MELSNKMVYLSDIDIEKVLWVFSICASPFFFIRFVRLPLLKKCQIFLKELVDPLMVGTYTGLPKSLKYVLYVTLYNSESLTIII